MARRLKRLRALLNASKAAWRQARARLRPAGRWAVLPVDALEPRRLFFIVEQFTDGLYDFRNDPRFVTAAGKRIDGTGSDIVVIDDAFDTSHSEFKDAAGNSRVIVEQDNADNDTNALNVNATHGTHVASIAAGTNFGVAPGARLLVFKIGADAALNADGDEAGLSTAAQTAALQWIQANKGSYHITSVNMSFGGGDFNTALNPTDARGLALTALGSDSGILLLAAAGNAYSSRADTNPLASSLGYATAGIGYPAANSKVVAVSASYEQNYAHLAGTGSVYLPAYTLVPGVPVSGATPAVPPVQIITTVDAGNKDQFTYFSNRDPNLTGIVAPGYQIIGANSQTGLELFGHHLPFAGDKGGVNVFSGTSQATPEVSGAVALLQQVALVKGGSHISADSQAGDPYNILSILQTTGTKIKDTGSGETFINQQTPGVAAAPMPTTNAFYRRIDIERAAEAILEHQLSVGLYGPATTAIEFNQNGLYTGPVTFSSATDQAIFSFPAQANGSTFAVKVSKPAAGAKNLPPGVVMLDTTTLPAVHGVRAPHDMAIVNGTFNSGVNKLVLTAQSAIDGAYNGTFTIAGSNPDNNHVHTFKELDAATSASPLSSSIGADQGAQYFSFLPHADSGTINVTIPGGSSLVPVLSIYDGKGTLLPGRVVGSSASGATLSFSGLKVGARYSIRVGSNNYASTGAFGINVAYAAFGSFGQESSGLNFAPASGPVSSADLDALRAAVDAFGRLATRYESTAEMTKVLPLLDDTQAHLAGVGNVVTQGFVDAFKSAIASATSVDDVVAALAAINSTFDNVHLAATPGSVAAYSANGKTVYTVRLEGTRDVDAAKIQLDNVSNNGGLTFDDTTTAPVETTFAFDLELSVNQDASLAPADRATIKVNEFTVHTAVQQQAFDALVTQGIAPGDVTSGSINFDALLSAAVHHAGQAPSPDGDELTATEMDGAQIADIVTNTPTGSVNADLPLDISVGDFDKADAALHVTDSNLYDATQPAATKSNWGDLDFFDNINPAQLITLIQGLKDKVQSLANMPAINTPIPFTDNQTISSLLGLDGLMAKVNSALTAASGAAAFLNTDDLIAKLSNFLGIPFLASNYNPTTHDLSFHIDFNKALSLNPSFHFEVGSSSVLSLAASADVAIGGTLDFGLTFGVNLSPPGSGVSLGDRFFISDGHIGANLSLNVTNLQGSAKLFNFVGVNLTGGSGTATASLSVDLFNKQRVTVNQIAASIANGGSAVTGANPVPAALSNLSFTGSASLDLGTFALTGVSLPLVGSPKLTIAIPNFKDPSTFTVDTSQLGDLLNFQNLSFDDLLGAIRAFVGNLKDKLAGTFFDKKIPGTGKSIRDLVDFIDKLSDAVSQLQDGDASSLEETAQKLEAKLETALGLSGNALTTALAFARNAANKPVLTLNLSASGSTSGSFGFDLDLASLLGGAGLSGLPALASSFVDASASGQISYSGAYSLTLGFGVDLSDPASPSAFVTDNSGITLSALVNANNTLNASLGIGPLGIKIVGGNLLLADDTNPSNPAKFAVGLPPSPGTGGRVPLSTLTTLFNTPSSLVSLHGQATVTLPMFNSLTNAPLPGVGGGNNVFTATIPHLDGLFNGTATPSVYSPDIASVLSSFDFSGGIGSLINGLDLLLGQLSTLFKGKMFGVDLPLIGSSLKSSAATGFIDDIRAKFQQTLSGGAATAADTIRTQIQSALNALGIANVVTMLPFNGTTQQPSVTSATTEIRYAVTIDGTKTIATGIDLSKGVPGLSFSITGPDNTTPPMLNAELGYHIGLAFGINKTSGFYIDTTAANEVTANAYLTFPGTTLGGTLSFLQLSATNGSGTTSFNSRNFTGSFFGAAFSADLKALPSDVNNRLTFADITSGNAFDADILDYTLAGKAHLDLNASVGINAGALGLTQASMPKLTANLMVDWGFNLSDVNPTPTGSPTIAFNNVRLDAGEFISREVAPILDRLENAIAPIRPAIDALTAPLPVANDIGPLRDYIDSHGNHDGIASLRDLAQAFPVNGVSTALGFLDLIKNIDGLYSDLSNFSPGGTSTLSLGNYSVSGTGVNAALVQTAAAAQTIDQQIAAATGATGTALRDFQSTQTFAGTIGDANLSFPILSHPTDLLQLLMGKDVTIVQLDLPRLEFGFNFAMSFPLFPFVNIDVSGGLKGFADLGVGYDTRGLRQFHDSGYSNFAALADGFYLRDKKKINNVDTDIPEFGLTGNINFYASLDAVLASISVGGGIDGELFADFKDPDNDGKLHLDEINLGNFPRNLLNMYGQVTASLKARASIGFWPVEKDYEKNIATVVLVDFNTGDGPVPGTISNHILTLTPTTGDDMFVVHHTGSDGSGEKLRVYGNGGMKDFTGVQQIRFDGSSGGNDRVTFVVDQTDSNGDGTVDQRFAVTSPATLIGGAGNDVFTGGDGADSIDGGAGNNTLDGGAGNDTLRAAAGDDSIAGGDGNDSITAGDGNNDIDAGAGADTATAGSGNDTMLGGSNSDSLSAGDGNNVLSGDGSDTSVDTVIPGNDTLIAGSGNDSISGGPASDSILAGSGNDTVQGDDANDFIDAGDGNDCVSGNAGNDTILGGEGNDTILGHTGQSSDSGQDDDRIFAGGGNDSVDAGLGNDSVEGGQGNDTILGQAGNDTLAGGGTSAAVDTGNDSISGGAGFDVIIGDDGGVVGGVVGINGGTGSDILDGGDDNDSLYGVGGNDSLSGGRGNDCLFGGDGADSLFGQDGNDTVLGDAGADQIQGFSGNDSLSGGDGDDQIVGGVGLDSIFGNAGNDDLYGNEDADLIYGNSGNDQIQGGAGVDTMVGGGGSDSIYGHSISDVGDDNASELIYGGRAIATALLDLDPASDGPDCIAGQGGNDTLFGEDGDDAITGGLGNDSIDAGTGNDLAQGNEGNDTVLGQAGDDVLSGNDGNDSIDAGDGNDRVTGDAGNDTLLGGVGNDSLDGGDGADSMLGGDGDDTLLGKGGIDRLFGENGNDSLNAGLGVGDYLDGGAGDDFILGSPEGSNDPNPSDTIAFGDSIFGQAGNDTIVALGGSDTVDAGTGDDSVDAGANNDIVLLGDGYDTALAGDGNDSVEGSTGNDSIYGEAGNDTLLGQDGSDLIDGGAGADSILGGNNDDDLRAGTGSGNFVFGEAGNDLLTGSNDGADLLDGGDGDDELSGLAGNDSLFGGNGMDIVDGGLGDDFIEGGAGADVLKGGGDNDVIYGHSQSGSGDDNAVDTLFGDFATGTDDAGAGRDCLFGGGGLDLLYGEGNDDFIGDFGGNDTINFGAGDGATPNAFVAPTPTAAPSALPAPTLSQRDATLPAGPFPAGRFAEFAGVSAGSVGQPVGSDTSIAIDASNRRYVAWSDARSGNAEVYVARFDGSAWSQLNGSASFGGVSNTATASVDPKITLDAAGNPIVVWTETTAAGQTNVYAARFDGSNWVALGTSETAGGISGTSAATAPRVVNTTTGPVVAWLDASNAGVTQVYSRRFNGTSWVETAAGSATGTGVSGSATSVSQLSIATDGTKVASAWTQTVGSLNQIQLSEWNGSVGGTFAFHPDPSGNGASNALYGATASTLAYFGGGGQLHLAFVAPTNAAAFTDEILARHWSGTSWSDSNTLSTPVAGASGQLSAPVFASSGGALRLGFLEQRYSPTPTKFATFGVFNNTRFVSELNDADADGFNTNADSIALALDSTGKPIVTMNDGGVLRAVAGGNGGAITRVFTATPTTSVQSILDANDLGPGDAIVLQGAVLGFTVAAGGDDAGVLITGERTASITQGVSVGVNDVQLQNLSFPAFSSLVINASNVSLLNSSFTQSGVNLNGANLSVAGNSFSSTVTDAVSTLNITGASGGLIAGNVFREPFVSSSPHAGAINVNAAFSGQIRGNTVVSDGFAGLFYGAAATVTGNTFIGGSNGVELGGGGLTFGGASIAPNRFLNNSDALYLPAGGTVLNQIVRNAGTGAFGFGTLGSANPADGNLFDNATTGTNFTGVIQNNTFTRNGVAIVATGGAGSATGGAGSAAGGTQISQNRITSDAGDGIRVTGPRVTITQNTIAVGGRAVNVTAGASETEVKDNVLIATGGTTGGGGTAATSYALYVDPAGRSGFFSDYNLLWGTAGTHLVHWFTDFDDLLDWQQDVHVYDLHSTGRTLVNPSATLPRFAALDTLAPASTIAGIRSTSPAVDLGDSASDVGVTRTRTNLLANPGFESGSAAGWNVDALAGVIATPSSAWDGTKYLSTGAFANGFAEQTVNLTTAGFTTTQLDSQDFVASFGARVRIAGATNVILTFLNGSSSSIGTSTFSGSADASRWELVGGRARIPVGTRSIKIRVEGVAQQTAIDSAFLYVESDSIANDAGAGGASATDLATNQPKIELRSHDLYTDLIVDQTQTVRWETFGDTTENSVKIDLLKDTANGPQFLLTLAATAPDTGRFDWRPVDFGLTAGTGGYRLRVALNNNDAAFDRSTEASAIPEAGDTYYVDDKSDANDQYTPLPGATGSNRNTGKLPSAPKPLLTSVLRIYDLGPSSVVDIDTGSYLEFAPAVISGTTGVGDDEGATLHGPTNDANVAQLNMAFPFTAFDINDGDAVTLEGIKITGASVGVLVHNNSVNFTGKRLTVVSPTQQGVALDSTATGTTLDRITVSGAGISGIASDVFLNSVTNATITGGAGTGLLLNAGASSVTGGLFTGNQRGVFVSQPSGVALMVSGNRALSNSTEGISVATGFGGAPVTISGNTASNNGTGIRIDAGNAGVVSGNVLVGNGTGIVALAGTVQNNRLQNPIATGIDATNVSLIAGNVVIGGNDGILVRNNIIATTLRNNLVYAQNLATTFATQGIHVSAATVGVLLENNTIFSAPDWIAPPDPGPYGPPFPATDLVVDGGSVSVTLRNNIFVAKDAFSRILILDSASVTNFASDYNLFYAPIVLSINGASTLEQWRTALGTDAHSLVADPLFVNASSSPTADYHEKSAFGSSHGGSLAPVLGGDGLPTAATITLTNDAQTSPAIDAADTATPFANEPSPNGGFANLGAYGNTSQASRSPASYLRVTSPNGAEQWPIGQTFPITWRTQDSGGTAAITLLRDSQPGFSLSIAAAAPDSGSFNWTLPGTLSAGSDYRIRVTRSDTLSADTSDAPFTIGAATTLYYVNDNSTANDVFATAIGTSSNNGLTPATPNTSIQYILDHYDLGPGDVIRIDSGSYTLGTDLIIAAQDSGVTITGPDTRVTPASFASINRGNISFETSVFTAVNADGVTLSNLTLSGGRYGVKLNASSDADDFTLDHVTVSGSTSGVDVETSNDRFTIKNSAVTANATFSPQYGVNVRGDNALIDSNTFNSTAGANVRINVGISVTGQGTIVRNNTITNSVTGGIIANFSPADPATATAILVQNNTLSSGGFTGISAQGAVVIDSNSITGSSQFGINAQGGLTLVKNNTLSNNTIGIELGGARALNNTVDASSDAGIDMVGTFASGNTVKNSGAGIRLSNGASVSAAMNNLLLNNAVGIDDRAAPQSAIIRIVNNTIVQSGGRGVSLNSGAVRAWLRNNLFEMTGGIALEGVAGSINAFDSDYNLYHMTGSAVVASWQGSTFATLAAWQNSIGFDGNGISAAPLFVNAATGNYTLQAGSPAQDKGDPDTYWLGEVANSGGRADIGAYGNSTSSLASGSQVIQVLKPNGGERLIVNTPTTATYRGFGIAATDEIALLDVGSLTGSGQWLWDSIYNSPWGFSNSTTSVNVAGVANAAPASVYQTYATSGSASGLRYTLPVPNGAYTLRLHFVEPSNIGAGQRVMDISVNNTLLAHNYDIIASGSAPFQANVLSLPVTAAGGTGLTINLADVVNDAVLSGIELVRTNAGGVASPKVNLDLTNNDSTYNALATNQTLDRYGRGSFGFTPTTTTALGRIKATSADVGGLTDTSDAVFNVVTPAANYYINDGTLDANDIYTTAIGNDANTGTSPASPMASLNALLSRYSLAGTSATIFVDAGTYALSGTISITADDAGVVIKGVSNTLTNFAANNTSFDDFTLSNADGTTLTNFGVTGARFGIFLFDGSDSDDVVIDGVRAFGNQSEGILVDNTNDRAVIRNSIAFGIPGGTSADDQQFGIVDLGSFGLITNNVAFNNAQQGITASSNVSNTAFHTVNGNEAYGNSRGIVINRASTAANNNVHNNSFAGLEVDSGSSATGNTATANIGGGAFGILTTFDATVSNNTVSGNTNGMSIGSGGIARNNTVFNNTGVGIQNSGVTSQVIGNTVFGNATGIQMVGGGNGTPPGNQVRNNLVYNNSVAALEVNGGGANSSVIVVFVNNTFVSSGAADAIRITGGANSQWLDFRNNILVASGTGYGINVTDPMTHYHVTGDYNLLNIVSGKIGRFQGVDYTSLAAWSGATLMDKHTFNADPQFNNAAANDYTLKSTSPAIDAGDPASDFSAEPSPNGLRINIGQQGNTAQATLSSPQFVQVTSPVGPDKLEAGQTVSVNWLSGGLTSPAGDALYASTILSQNPALYLKLGDTSGITAIDSSGNGRNGVYTAGPLLGQPSPFPTGTNTAVHFDGVDDVVSVAASPALNLRRTVTLSAWIKPDSLTPTWQTIFYKSASNIWQTRTYSLFLNTAGFVGMSSWDSSAERWVQTPNGSVPAGQWTHVVAVMDRDHGTMSIYLNGKLSATNTAIGTADAVDSPGAPVLFGNTPEFPAAFGGEIDEAAVFPTALTAAQVAAQFGADKGSIKVELLNSSNAVATVIGVNLPNTGTTSWTIPANLPEDQYRIRITYSNGTTTLTNTSATPFLITNSGTSYYVNNNSTAGDIYTTAIGNDANSGKSPDKPMASLQALLDAYDLDAGDTVFVDAGTYTLPINLLLNAQDSGMAIVGAGKTATIFTRGITNFASNVFDFEMNGASNVRLANMGITGAFVGVFSAGGLATGLTVEDSAIYGNYTTGFSSASDNNLTFRRDQFYGLPGGNFTDDQSYGINTSGSNLLVQDSEFFDLASTGVNFTGDGLITGNHAFRNSIGINVNGQNATNPPVISFNEVFNNTSSGITAANSVIVDHNRAYNQTAFNAAGITLSTFGTLTASNNEAFNNYNGIVNGLGVNAYMTGNRVYANTHAGFQLFGGKLYNNTIFSNDVGVIITGNANELSNNLLYANTNHAVTASNLGSLLATGNTIFQDVGDGFRLNAAPNVTLIGNIVWTNSGYDIDMLDTAGQASFASDYNLFFKGGSAAANIGFWAGAARSSLANWQSASAKDGNSIFGDPKFVDIDGADNALGYVGGIDHGLDDNFHLKAGSPAIDHGDAFFQLAQDAGGNNRANDPSSPDLGAFSYTATDLGTSNFAATGNATNFRGDTSATTITWGFAFPFYGGIYTNATLTTNGRLLLGGFNNFSGANSLTGLYSDFATIAPMWDDVRTDGKAADNVFVDSSVANQFTIRWRATNKADGSDVNFSVTLYGSGNIDFNYGAGNTNLTPTIGISPGGNRPLYVLSPQDSQATLTNAHTIRFSMGPAFADAGAFEFLGNSADTTLPTVVGTTPSGIHTGSTVGGIVNTIGVNFSEPLDSLDARSTSVYQLLGAGPDNSFGTSDDTLYSLTPNYTPLSTSVSLAIAGSSLPSGLYKLTVKGTPAGNSGLHDLAGNVLDGAATGVSGGDYVRVFSVIADATPPTVTASAWVFDQTPPRITLAFSESIGNSLAASDLLLQNLTTGLTINPGLLNVSYTDASHVVITYTGSANGALPDGQYRLTLAAGAVADLAGNPLANPFVTSFVSLGGDSDGNGAVDFNDLLVLAQNYNQSPRTYRQGDMNYDGVVNFDDLLILAQHYGQSISNALTVKVLSSNFGASGLTQAVTVQFSADVSASFSTADLDFRNLTTGQIWTPAQLSISNVGSNTMKITWPGIVGPAGAGILPDGNCQMTLFAAGITSAGGLPLEADKVLSFRFVNADANSDGTVNFSDLLVVAQNYNVPGVHTLAQGDFNFDGNVNFLDLLILAQRYGQSVSSVNRDAGESPESVIDETAK